MVSEFGLTGNRSNPFSSICISPIYLLDMDSYFVCLFIHEGIKEHDIYIYIYIYIYICSSIFCALNSLFCKLLFIIN